MKSREEIKNWLLENCVDENGDLDISNLNFSDFDGDIFIDGMTVKNNLVQCCQTVGGNLYQDNQTAKGDLEQNGQIVLGNFITQTLKNNEEYKIENRETYIVKKEREKKKMENIDILKECKQVYELLLDLKENCNFNILENKSVMELLYTKTWETMYKETKEREYLRTLAKGAICPNCKSDLLVSDILDYAYLCDNCDENYYYTECELGCSWWTDKKKEGK